MKVKGMISEAPPRSSLTEGAPQRSGEGSWAEERGGEGGGCYSSRMEMGEEAVFKTAGFRVREAEARGSCRGVDADRDDARRAVEGVADGLVAERHEGVRRDLQLVGRQPGGPRLFAELGLGDESERLSSLWVLDQSTSVTPVCPRRFAGRCVLVPKIRRAVDERA